jgi:hypothetical protein
MMELDKTSIVLRQRSLLDIIDLSLVVVRVYRRPLLICSAIGVIPFFIINFLVLQPMLDFESLFAFNQGIIDEGWLRFRHSAFQAGLILTEAPIALLAVTHFLGQAVFFERPSLRDLTKILGRQWLAIVWLLGLFRLGLVTIFLCVPAAWSYSWNEVYEIFWLGIVVVGISMSFRAFRPFAPELLVLEEKPLFVTKKAQETGEMSFSKRSAWLHRPMSGELFARFLAMSFAMACLLLSLTLGELFFCGVFFGEWTWGWWMQHLLFPLNVWFVAVWGCVFRLLSYLDTRTRLEDWELTLRLRAEAARLAGGEV